MKASLYPFAVAALLLNSTLLALAQTTTTYSTPEMSCASAEFDQMDTAANARALYNSRATSAARKAAVNALTTDIHALWTAAKDCSSPSQVLFRNGFLVTYNTIYRHFTHASDAGDADLILANQMLHKCMSSLEGSPEGAACERRLQRNEKIAPTLGDE